MPKKHTLVWVLFLFVLSAFSAAVVLDPHARSAGSNSFAARHISDDSEGQREVASGNTRRIDIRDGMLKQADTLNAGDVYMSFFDEDIPLTGVMMKNTGLGVN